MKTKEKSETASANFRSDCSTPAIEAAFLTDSQAAEYLNLTSHQLYLHRRSGTGPPFVQHGVRIRYPVDALKQWAAALPRFTSVAAAYAANPKRANAAAHQRAATAKARKTRWRKETDVTTDDCRS
jgi:hypothetical protein